MPATYTIPRNYKHRQRNIANRGRDIINYDSDNAYPQRVLQVLMASSTGVACSNLYAKFIYGNGFTDLDIQNLIINRKQQTAGQLLRLISKDYARFGLFAIHVNYNANYEIAEFTRIDPRYVRFGLPDTNEFIPKIAVYNDWALDNYKVIKRKEIDYINVYNPKKEAVQKQIEVAGGINKYKGQVLYFTGHEQTYPVAPHDSVLDDLEIDAKISRHSLNELDKGFMAKHILKVPFEFENDEQRQKFKADLKNVEGEEGDSILVLEATLTKEDQGVELLPVDHTYTDLKFVNTQESARQKIYRSYNQPSILHSDYKENGLSSSDQIKTAFDFYNQHTSDGRSLLASIFADILTHFSLLGEIDELEIEERKFVTGAGNISERIGESSTNSLLNILSGNMPPKQKKQVLINVFGIVPERADLLVDSGDNEIKENADVLNS